MAGCEGQPTLRLLRLLDLDGEIEVAARAVFAVGDGTEMADAVATKPRFAFYREIAPRSLHNTEPTWSAAALTRCE